jgi:hypothetical protein
MKVLLISILFITFQLHIVAQGAFLSIGSGVSNLSSNFDKRYSFSYNFTLKAGYDKRFDKFGIRTTLGYFNHNSKIVENNKSINIGLIKLSSGFFYDISSSISILGQLGIGKTTKKSLRISSPRYNYDFDPFDFSYSIEITKRIKLENLNFLSLGLEFSRSIDGIIDNNFWQKDNLKPYYLNINIYYYFESM